MMSDERLAEVRAHLEEERAMFRTTGSPTWYLLDVAFLLQENTRLRERVAHYENGLRRLIEELTPNVPGTHQ